MNLDTTKRLLQLTTDLHSLNNKLYQLKITSEVFVVDENEYLVEKYNQDILKRRKKYDDDDEFWRNFENGWKCDT